VTDDFVDALRADDARSAAVDNALRRPPRPHGTTKTTSNLDPYVQAAFDDEIEAVRTASEGNRNPTLNTSAFNLGQLVGVGALDFDTVCRELTYAAKQCGLSARELRQTDLPQRAVRDGMSHPRDLSDVGTQQEQTSKTKEHTTRNGSAAENEFEEKTLRLKFLGGVKSRVPMWVWEYDGVGRIQLGTLSMFAGKPTAGKSTAVRWFAARLSRGELPGVWYGHPMKVALVMSEEQTDAVVVPGLQAAGADMGNICIPQLRIGATEFGITTADERKLTEELLQYEVAALFIDPIMSTFSGKADIYRNNEVRIGLAPFTRIAAAINGIVVGVTHLRKGEVRDVLGGINGSSAFGEVPRAVFGFAPTDAGEHVMEQVKNSAGPTGLKLAYKLPVQRFTADDGQTAELPCFDIIGPTEISISDIDSTSDETTGISVACQWLSDYLQREQPAPSAQCKRDAKCHGDISERMLIRAMKRLGVVVASRSYSDKPHTTVWSLP
jgi:hypothetical protein